MNSISKNNILLKVMKMLFVSIFIISNNLISSCCSSTETESVDCCDNTAVCNKKNVKTVFIPLMAQGCNLYTQYHKPVYIKENCNLGVDIYVMYRFQQSLNSCAIAESLFQYNPLIFQGDPNADDSNRDPKALIPEYFGMSEGTSTSLNLAPRIRNNIFDLQMTVGGEWFWIQANIPVMKANWEINSGNVPVNNYFIGSTDLQGSAEAVINYEDTPATTNKFKNYKIKKQIYRKKKESNSENELSEDTEKKKKKKKQNSDYVFEQYNLNSSNNNENNSNLLNINNNLKEPIPETDQSFTVNDIVTTIPGYSNDDEDGFTTEIMNAELDISGEYDDLSPVQGIGLWGSIDYIQCEDDLTLSSTFQPLFGNVDGVIQICPSAEGQDVPPLGTIISNLTKCAPSMVDALSGYTFGLLQDRSYNKFNFNGCNVSTFKLADLQLKFGVDFVKCEDKHAGCYIRLVIPTGTVIDSKWNEYVFSPVVGNGNHYELGFGATAHMDFECKGRNISVFLEGYIDHLFSSNQFRTFDMPNLPMSRYALVKELIYVNQDCSDIAVPSVTIEDPPADYTDPLADIIYPYGFTGNIYNLGDLNAIPVDISIDLKGEAVIDIILNCNNYTIGAGYSIFGQTAEKISQCSIPGLIDNSKNNIDNVYYGYVGSTYTTSMAINGIDSIDSPDGTPLPFSPNNNQMFIQWSSDVSLEGASGAYLYGEPSGKYYDEFGEFVTTQPEDVFTLPEVYGNCSGAMGSQILNKIFAHAEYTWESIWKPTLGVFGAFAISPSSYLSANYFEFGAKFEFYF